MKKRTLIDGLKRKTCLALSIACMLSLAGCGNASDNETKKSDNTKKATESVTEKATDAETESETENTSNKEVKSEVGVNLRNMIDSLMATDEELGLKGTYNTLDDIKDGRIDESIVGTWYTSDGKTSYKFKEDGTQTAETEYGNNSLKYTCVDINDLKVLCYETTMKSTDADGNTTESQVMGYNTYFIDNDALYMVSVEDTTRDDMNSSFVAVTPLYKADDSGNFDSAVKKNPIDLATFEGKWDGDSGNIEIKDGVLTTAGENYNLSMDNSNNLVVEKDGDTTTYDVAVYIKKDYTMQDLDAADYYSIGIYYEGKDEKDVPNLIGTLEDWHAEYGTDSFYYSGSFNMVKE